MSQAYPSAAWSRYCEMMMLTRNAAILLSIIMMLYHDLCVQEKAPSLLMTVFRLAIEWIQLFLLLVSYQYGYNGLVSGSGT